MIFPFVVTAAECEAIAMIDVVFFYQSKVSIIYRLLKD
jgi:hypothetical protein